MFIKSLISNQGVISHLIVFPNNKAVVIDPCVDLIQKIVLEIKQNNLSLEYVIETHTHADFFSARQILKKLYPQTLIAGSRYSKTKDYDLKLDDSSLLKFEDFKLTSLETPGHTQDSITVIISNDKSTAIFTGDTLLIGGTGRTDFQNGSSLDLYSSLEKILHFPEYSIIYPAHNYQGQTKTTLGVEKQTNTRLKLVLENKIEEFSTLLNGHSPTKPDLFEESLGWNQL